jgi:hypothetical protein
MLLALAGLFLYQSPMPPPSPVKAGGVWRYSYKGQTRTCPGSEPEWVAKYLAAAMRAELDAAPPAPVAGVETFPLPAAAPPQTPCPT